MGIKNKFLIVLLIIFSTSLISSGWFGYDTEPNDNGNNGGSVTINLGNLTNFIQLSDTPNAYAGQAGLCAIVNVGETALEFGACGTGGTDGNASSICSGTEVLLGNGSCQTTADFGAADTNESTRFGNLVLTNCAGTDKVTGVLANGTINCSTDDTGAGGTPDGNASSICIGDQVLLGNGTCQNSTDFTGVGGNVSWNQSYAETLFSPNTTAGVQSLINLTVVLFQQVFANDWTNVSLTVSQISDWTTQNDTYEAYALNVSLNHTQIVFDTWDDHWDDPGTGDNETWNQTEAERLFLEEGLLWDAAFNDSFDQRDQSGSGTDGNASSICAGDEVLLGNGSCQTSTDYINSGGDFSFDDFSASFDLNLTLLSLQDLLNTTGIYSTSNTTYDNYATNVSINYTEQTVTGYDSRWLDGGSDGNASSICSGDTEVLLGNGSCQTTADFGATDTNESTRFTALTDTDCNGNEKAVGVWTNGTIKCSAVAGGGDFSFSDFTSSFLLNITIMNNTKVLQEHLNATGIYSTYNATYDNYATNVSRNWTEDTFNAYNATWDDGGGVGNASWNQSLAHTLFDTTYNATYDNYATNVSLNETERVFDTWNAVWSAGTTIWDATFNSSLLDYIGILNTTKNVQELLNDTGIYSTYNVTYANYATNVSINYTEQTVAGYDSRWLDGSPDGNASSICTGDEVLLGNGSCQTTADYINSGGDFSFDDFSASFILNSTIINTTKNVQELLNDTGIYSTYNATYDNYADNVSKNYTERTYDAYNTHWLDGAPDGNASSICSVGEYLDGNSSCVSMNDTISNFLTTTYHNASQSQLIEGSLDGGTLVDTQHPDASYDGKTLNFSEVSGSPGLEMRVNFTGITDFSQGIMRYKTSELSGDYPIRQLWNYDTSEWEDYPVLSESLTFTITTQTVYDHSDHVQDGVVQMRIYKEGNGNTNNHYYIDWVTMAEGVGVPSGQEVDPYSYHTDVDIEFDGYNINGSGAINTTGNITADFYFGDGSNLTNLPIWNAIFNSSLLDFLNPYNTTANIQSLLNDTGIYSTYNSTYDNYALNVSYNYSEIVFDTWDVRWVQTLWDATFNSSLLDYIQIVNSTYNATYDAYSTNVSNNWTEDTVTGYDVKWSDTSNTTYDSYALNVSLNETEIVFDTWDTRWVQELWGATFNSSLLDYIGILNTTKNVQELLNSTGIYETYNATYALYNYTDTISSVNTTKNIQELLNGTELQLTNINITNNITTEGIVFESDPNNHRMYDNATCIIFKAGDTEINLCE